MSASAIARARQALAARGRGIEAVDVDGVGELRGVIHLAREMFAGDPLWGVPNLALMPALPYYTGIVFEAFHPGVGFPIAAGGRYDLLLGAFGAARPATGFAINVPRLHLALFSSGWRPQVEETLVTLAPGDPVVTARLAGNLRRKHVIVAIGATAESAGLKVLEATAVDETHVKLKDGRTLAVEALANETVTKVLH
jgi:ATP phosphoribosyltransferase regulatory subunit HisZ